MPVECLVDTSHRRMSVEYFIASSNANRIPFRIVDCPSITLSNRRMPASNTLLTRRIVEYSSNTLSNHRMPGRPCRIDRRIVECSSNPIVDCPTISCRIVESSNARRLPCRIVESSNVRRISSSTLKAGDKNTPFAFSIPNLHVWLVCLELETKKLIM